MATPEERARKKQLSQQWRKQQAQQESNQQLKEKLQSDQYWRKYGDKAQSGFSTYAARDRGIQQGPSVTNVNETQVKNEKNADKSGGESSGVKEAFLGGAKVVYGGAAGALSRVGSATPQIFSGMDPWV